VSDHSDLNRATYDRIADRYFENQNRTWALNDDLFGALEGSFLAQVPPTGAVADTGCGPALDGARFAARGYRVIGVDVSHGMLDVASQQLPGRVVRGDLRGLPLASGQLDGIWCVASLLHVPEPDTARVLGELRRTLRYSGSLALVTTLGEGQEFEEVPYAPGERRWFVYRQQPRLLEQLRGVGFTIEFETQAPGNRLWSTVLARAI
jgi:SAM-dependent methyltransferase